MRRAGRAAATFVVVAFAALAGGAAPRSLAGAPPAAAARDLAGPWPLAAPESVGLDPLRLEVAAARAARQPRTRSLVVARHGALAFERYATGAGPETPFDVRSVTKSVVSLLAGIAARDQSIAIDASITPHLSTRWRLDAEDDLVTPRHLLTMTSGFAWDESTAAGYNAWVTSPDPVQYVLDRPHSAPPAQRWNYNSGGVHLLGVVLQRALGRPLPEYAQERLFAPLGITSALWEPLPDDTVNGGSGLDLNARDLLKLGQLVLQRGWSGEREIVPEAWIAETTRPAYAWRRAQGPLPSVGYGGLWWVSDPEPAAFFAWGYGGQFLYVSPALDLVVVVTTEWRSLTETTPDALAYEALGVIVDDVAAAVVAP
jgi:CubicO group peptidase (beta-lactamase class C family)